MAKIVLGLGASHAPSLSTPVEVWQKHSERDKVDHKLWFRGQEYSYEELEAARAGEQIGPSITDEKWLEQYAACEAGVEAVRSALHDVKADVIVIVGDDQLEMFLKEAVPAIAIYSGESILVDPVDEEDLPEATRPARWAMYGTETVTHACQADLSTHLIDVLNQAGFDITQAYEVAEGRTLGHAYNYYYQRLLAPGESPVPIVPIFINAAHPPNQPTASRMVDFGKTVRQAIDSWDSELRVAVFASGGLSHFAVDEELDRGVLAALEANDEQALREVAHLRLMSSTGEIRNWIAVGSALADFRMEVLDYIPIYRTPAGTGVGMAYALWRPAAN